MPFIEDNEEARIVENRVAEWITAKTGFPVIHAPDYNFPDYDLQQDLRTQIGGRFEKLFEVKNDKQVAHFGNAAIEFRCNGKPSGLLISKAEWWVIVVEGLAHFVERNALLQALVEGLQKGTANIRFIGENKSSETYLMPVERLKKLSKVIDRV